MSTLANQMATCHPERRARALGLCGSCYVMSRPEYGLRRIPRAVVPRLLEARGGRCRYCQEPLELADATADHVIPRSRGGSDDESNLVAACGSCNSRKWADDAPEGITGSTGPVVKPRDQRATARAAGEMPLAEAAVLLGLAQESLRHQAANGRLRARVIGKTWWTTTDEVDRYRRENLGRVGRPRRTA